MTPRHLALPTLAVALVQAACSSPTSDRFEFVLVGDNPYPPENIPAFEALINDVNAHDGLEWVVHVGDTRGGGPTAQPCSDEVLRGRFELYQGFDQPLVFTPGDNDWFDCVDEAAGGYDEYERLALIRNMYFSDPGHTTGGRAMEVRSQSLEPGFEEFVENALWVRGGVAFSTVHLVGLTREPNDPDAAAHRLDAALAWIDTTFQVAAREGSVGVFIATQLDPWVVWGLPPLVRQRCATCLEPRPGLESLYSSLVAHSDSFQGQVVLAVGDTHIFRVDKPLYRDDGTLVENFTRVEAFGNPNVHWVRVTVDPTDRGIFTFHQEVVPENRVTRSR